MRPIATGCSISKRDTLVLVADGTTPTNDELQFGQDSVSRRRSAHRLRQALRCQRRQRKTSEPVDSRQWRGCRYNSGRCQADAVACPLPAPPDASSADAGRISCPSEYARQNDGTVGGSRGRGPGGAENERAQGSTKKLGAPTASRDGAEEVNCPASLCAGTAKKGTGR